MLKYTTRVVGVFILFFFSQLTTVSAQTKEFSPVFGLKLMELSVNAKEWVSWVTVILVWILLFLAIILLWQKIKRK